MDIKTNCFYLLKASLDDTRVILNEKASELEFELGEEICQKCLTDLTNPRRRIYSEIRWFLDETKEDIQQIVEKINSNNKLDSVSSDLSILNIIDYWYKYDDTGSSQLNYLKHYYNTIQGLSCEKIVDSINRHRKLAGFSEASFTDVSTELNSYLSEIENKVLDSIFSLDQKSQSDLVFNFANSIASKNQPYPEWGFPQAILGRYELLHGDEINKEEEKIKEFVDKGQTEYNYYSKNFLFEQIDQKLQDWESIARPISFINYTNGIHRRSSMTMLYSIRDFILYLNNEKREYLSALDLIRVLVNHCEYFPVFSDVLSEEASTINQNQTVEEQNKRNRERAAKAHSVDELLHVFGKFDWVIGILISIISITMCSV